MCVQAIKLWEEARNLTCLKEKKALLIQQLTMLFQGQVKNWMMKACSERMLAFLVAKSMHEIRLQLFAEIDNKEVRAF